MRGLTQLSLLTLLSSLLSACVIDQNLSQPDVYLCNSDDDCISGFFCEESLEEDDQEVTGFCVPIEDDGDDEATDISERRTQPTQPMQQIALMQRTHRIRQIPPMPVRRQTVPTQARPPTRQMRATPVMSQIQTIVVIPLSSRRPCLKMIRNRM